MRTLIRGATLLTMDDRFTVIPDGDLLIDGDRIASVGPGTDPPPAVDEVVDARGRVAIPGLINAHFHSYGALLKGHVDNVPLDLFILHAATPVRTYTAEHYHLCALLSAVEMVKTGTTSALDHLRVTPGQLFEGGDAAARAYAQVGLRTVIAPMFGDRAYLDTLPEDPDLAAAAADAPPAFGRPADARDYLAQWEELFRRWHGGADGRIQIFLGTDGPQRSTDALLEATRDLSARYGVGIHSHVLESKTQLLRAHELYGKSMVAHLDDLGVLGPRMTLVHFIWCTEEDMARAAARGASVVHNPAANLSAGDGIAPVDRLLTHGMAVGLGTDGPNVGPFSVFAQLTFAIAIHRVSHPVYERWPTARDVLRLAYRGGAKVVGLDGEIGVLQPGARADIALLDGSSPALAVAWDLHRVLVFNETGASVETVYIGGRPVMRDRRLLTVDEHAVRAEARRVAAFIREKAGPDLEAMASLHRALRAMHLRANRRPSPVNRYSRPPEDWPADP